MPETYAGIKEAEVLLCVFEVGAKEDFTRKKQKGGTLESKWIGPFQMLHHLGNGIYFLSSFDNPAVKVRKVTGAHLKPYHRPTTNLENSLVHSFSLSNVQPGSSLSKSADVSIIQQKSTEVSSFRSPLMCPSFSLDTPPCQSLSDRHPEHSPS